MGIDTRDPTMRQVLLVLSLSLACSAFDNPIQWLLDDLFEDQQYDSNIIPMKNVAKETGEGSVNLHLELKVINMDMDEAGFLSVNAWPTYQWNDYRLTWDPEQYRGISQIRVPASMVWRPDIIIYNQKNFNAEIDLQTSKLDIYNVVIYSSGTVLWIPTVNFQVDCAGDEEILTIDDPSQPQECHIKMGSWTYDANHINITTMPYKTEKMDLESFSINSRYVVMSQEEESIHSKTYDCCPESYMHVDYKFKVQRAYHVDNDGRKIFDMEPKEIYEVVKNKKINI